MSIGLHTEQPKTSEKYFDSLRTATPEKILFRAEREDPVVITKLVDFKGEDVFCMACYGYPFVFLAEGAKSVVVCDLSISQLCWNEILGELIETDKRALILRLLSGGAGVGELLSSVPKSHERYGTCAEEVLFAFSNRFVALKPTEAHLPIDYAFIYNEDAFCTVKNALLGGGAVFRHGELLQVLDSDCSGFDVVHLSSVRSWVAFKGYDVIGAQYYPDKAPNPLAYETVFESYHQF